ncbi:acyl-CoA mutase large subunit family protein [Phytomonospora endophytica]|uniref:Methylmalonyl-CoA mutase N-terminal domain/subunit n=1 Tax=Phytomonospora endophytica TaxID=714109 RepID=A0A841FCU6_9ACTN|nr:methylmalonyl-CoA mutase family protein [Phytomonospora endophytica]MBB6035111.1 methylmalonyl-CoA mutase N-terminal domain/subunit [Phytomonospora endophytica]GIG64141.1 methylmalonyl-CoA mutase [Phytomonospora endophytica]
MSEQPGEFPYTRGISAEPKPWIMGQYAGFATAAESNRRFRELLAAGQTGFSVALDLPTQLGLDSDDPRAAGEVGRVGVALDSLADLEILLDGIDLAAVTQVRTTANSIGYLWAAMFLALAEKRGVVPDDFGLFIQNDVLKEFIARGTQIFPPRPSLSLAVDTMEHLSKHAPRWVPLAMSGYHMAEAGGDAATEVGYTFANAIAYLDSLVDRGVDVDAVAPSLYTFLSVGMDFLGEVAKLRAARRVWAKLVRDRYGATDPRSGQLRIFAFTAGSSLTAQQPLNNVARTAIEALAAACGGVQTLHVCAYDEALGVPTADAATLALRTQQVVAFETGLTEVADPLGGSYEVEARTDACEKAIAEVMADIEARGGALACIEAGYQSGRLADAAYRQAVAVESGERTVVGVNRHASPPEPLDVFRIDPAAEAGQIEAVRRLRATRDASAVEAALAEVETAARKGENIVPACVTAMASYATLGEVVARLRAVHGSWVAAPGV